MSARIVKPCSQRPCNCLHETQQVSSSHLQAGQFIGARGDFVPKPICQKLSLLHDQVPPMPPAQVRTAIEGELGAPLEQVDSRSTPNLV